jgi:hypothetical protein
MGAADDASRDDLQGGQGSDWFLARLGPVPPADVSDRTAQELLTTLS